MLRWTAHVWYEGESQTSAVFAIAGLTTIGSTTSRRTISLFSHTLERLLMDYETPPIFDDPRTMGPTALEWLRDPLSIPVSVLDGSAVRIGFDPAVLGTNTRFGLESETADSGGFENVKIEVLKEQIQALCILLELEQPAALDQVIEQQVRLAAIAYTDCVNSPLRKTGEPARFHPQRMALYFLTSWIDCLKAIDQQIPLRARPEPLRYSILSQTVALLMGTLFHDMGEDTAGEHVTDGKRFIENITTKTFILRLQNPDSISPFSLGQFALALPGKNIQELIKNGKLIIPFNRDPGSGNPLEVMNAAALIVYGLTIPEEGLPSAQKRAKFFQKLKNAPFSAEPGSPAYRQEQLRRSQLKMELGGIYVQKLSHEYQILQSHLKSIGYDMNDLHASMAQYEHLRDTACRFLYLDGRSLLAAGLILAKISDLLDNMLTRNSPNSNHLAKKSQESIVFLPLLLRDLNTYLTALLYDIDVAGSHRPPDLPGMYPQKPVLDFSAQIRGIRSVSAATFGPLLGVNQTTLYGDPENRTVSLPDAAVQPCSIPRPDKFFQN